MLQINASGVTSTPRFGRTYFFSETAIRNFSNTQVSGEKAPKKGSPSLLKAAVTEALNMSHHKIKNHEGQPVIHGYLGANNESKLPSEVKEGGLMIVVNDKNKKKWLSMLLPSFQSYNDYCTLNGYPENLESKRSFEESDSKKMLEHLKAEFKRGALFIGNAHGLRYGFAALLNCNQKK